MANQLNTGSIQTLTKGDTLLVNAQQVANGKVQLEFAEIIKSSTTGVNVLAMLNKSDDRFSSGARRAWVTVEPVDAEELLGINLGASQNWYTNDKGREQLDLNVLNPVMHDARMRVLITETTEPTEYQAENYETQAKRRGKDGPHILHNGDYIFSNSTVILTNEMHDSMHTFLEPDSTSLKTQVAAAAAFESDDMELM